MKSDYLIFCDFDGTIATRDVGYHLMTHFSRQDNSDLQELWNTRQIGARECLKIEAARVDATREEMLAFTEQFSLDPHFEDFVAEAERRATTVIVLSDGLDYYINHLLARHNLERLEVFSNRGVFKGRELHVEFPHTNGCGVCGSCKAARIREIVEREDFDGEVVFVGDGYSDLCAITEAHHLFAKKDLRRYCEAENIPHQPFDSFAEISRRLFGAAQ
ncbi:MAG TPA: MtnX-like HAD-IB family phosphatase [candidate division Zixibacteria bacterium]|nr:MtnX-like HAD-IB family phosphatase [candidate division Zixibacteria bacterium]